MFSAIISLSLRPVWHLCNLPCVKALLRLISIARRDVFFSVEEFAFEGQKMKFTMNMLLTCILCDTGRGCD